MAKWRKQLSRGVLAGLVCAMGGGGWLTYQVTSGQAVREQILVHLRKQFVGADVALGSAQLRLLGGITIDNFTLYRRDDPDRTPILHVPTGIIYHDKEQLAQGKLAIRKLKLIRPRLVVSRESSGQWNFADILGPVRPDCPIPVIEVEQGTIVVKAAADTIAASQLNRIPGLALPLHVELRQINITAINQPLPVVTIDASGDASSLGPVRLHATWQRTPGKFDATLDVAPIAVGKGTVHELEQFAPAVAEPIQQIAGIGRLHVDLHYRPEGTPRWSHQLRVELTQGRLIHRDLPLALENVEMAARCDDGIVTIERFAATSGPATIRLKAQLNEIGNERRGKTATPIIAVSRVSSPVANDGGNVVRAVAGTPHPTELLAACLEPFRNLELTIERLPLTPELFARLPSKFEEYQQHFAPYGPVDVTCRLERSTAGWTLRAKARLNGISTLYHHFPYPLRGVRGDLDLTLASGKPPRLNVDLTAEAMDHRPVTIRGWVEGDEPAFAYTIATVGIPIDEYLLQALPTRFQNQTRAFHPRGRCDITAQIERAAGATQARMHYVAQLRNASICYDYFPYPLDGLSGTLDIRLGPGTASDPRAETCFTFRDVQANRAGGRVFIDGVARPAAEGNLVTLQMRGERVAVDDTLAGAFERMKLRAIWDMFAPSGRFDFRAEVSHLDRLNGLPTYDIHVTPSGATIRPAFFPYALTDLIGTFHLKPGIVHLDHFSARHGMARLDLGGGKVEFVENGYRADLRTLQAAPLPVDDDFVRALPAALQLVFRALEPTGTTAINIAQLIIDQPRELAGPGRMPVITWNGGISFANARLQTGVLWENVAGQVACSGRYRGSMLECVEGHVAIDHAAIFGQPISDLHANVRITPQRPHELQLLDIRGRLFGGQLGGEAHVSFGAGLQYELDIKALGVRLEEFGKHNRIGGGNAQLSGPARAELYLKGTGNGIDELEGRGNIHVLNGRIYNLPLILDLLLKVSRLHAPDRTAFEEAHADFEIHGRRVFIQRLDLLGSGLSLGGAGEMNLDGTDMKMDFYAVWAHIAQVLPAGWRDIPPWLSKNLMLLRASGPVAGPYKIRTDLAPPLVDPLRQFIERVRVANPLK